MATVAPMRAVLIAVGISKEIRDLIRKISAANPAWGSPCSVGELGKLGIKVAKSTV